MTPDALAGLTGRSRQEDSMSKLKLNITMSIDGFVAGPDQSPEHPLGVGGEQLHNWLVSLKAFRESHGEEGGEVNASTPFAEDILGGAGATIMGRNMFGGGPGAWDESWQGWWGDDPPFHHPVFVVTRHPREPLELKGGTTFHFVTDGIEAALEQARAAAGEKEVSLGGGASVAQQYLAADLLDEIVVSVVPVLLGGGARLFENVGAANLEQVESVGAPGVTHIRYARATPGG
jgi:dihydrofolate reductase